LKIHALRLNPGQDLKEELIKFSKENNIKAGFIHTCVGSLNPARLRLSNLEIKEFPEKFEIVSLVGTLCVDDVHIHISIANSEGKTIGGHLKEGCLIDTTAEIIIGESEDHIFTREHDDLTGFDELKIRKLQ